MHVWWEVLGHSTLSKNRWPIFPIMWPNLPHLRPVFPTGPFYPTIPYGPDTCNFISQILTFNILFRIDCVVSCLHVYIHYIIQTDSTLTLSCVKCTLSYVKLVLLCKLHTLFRRRSRRLSPERYVQTMLLAVYLLLYNCTMINKDLLPLALGLMILPEKSSSLSK